MRINKKNNFISYIKQDCERRGRGRKKLWAEQLGVSSMTLSHWLVGRRQPSARHLEKIYLIIETQVADSEKSEVSEILWQAYYDEKPISPALLRNLSESLLRSSGLPTRLLALLSWFFEKTEPTLPDLRPVMPAWRNRLGWLYESAGLEPVFKPAPIETVPLLELSANIGNRLAIKKYLVSWQTGLGKKWRVYDCPLDALKAQLDWRNMA